MNDRELLELAVKAAGIEGEYVGCDMIRKDDDQIEFWNPLTDDGDAFRLAVKLGLEIFISRHSECTYVTDALIPSAISVKEYHDNDPCAATRRAIVRAVAKIEEGMK